MFTKERDKKVDTEMNFQEEIPCKTWTAPKPLWVKCNNGILQAKRRRFLGFER